MELYFIFLVVVYEIIVKLCKNQNRMLLLPILYMLIVR